MTATYDLTNNIGKVRLIVGDTDITNAIFTDAEISYFLTKNSDNVNLAAADVLEAWAAKYGAAPDNEKIGDYSYSQTAISKMMALAKRLRDTDSSTPYMTWSEMDLTGIDDTTVSEDIE